MKFHRTTLEQWRVLQAIVELGGFAQAAKGLNRSQSAISYAVNSLQEQLGTQLLEMQGRRSVLTAEGQALLRRAVEVLTAMEDVEAYAQQLKQGLESELWIEVDSYFPPQIVMAALRRFGAENAKTKLQLRDKLTCREHETVDHPADIAISTKVRESDSGEAILSIALEAVASIDHPLAQYKGTLRRADLSAHMLIAVCEAGTLNPADRGWLNVRSRWMAASLQQALELVRNGLGYAWLPHFLVDAEVTAGRLAYLSMPIGGIRQVQFFLSLNRPSLAGAGAWALCDSFKEEARLWQQSQATSHAPI